MQTRLHNLHWKIAVAEIPSSFYAPKQNRKKKLP